MRSLRRVNPVNSDKREAGKGLPETGCYIIEELAGELAEWLKAAVC